MSDERKSIKRKKDMGDKRVLEIFRGKREVFI